ncbi:uncharacterized protein PFL1_06701 [Pseudozyma flocculosa PF-1]|uniref:Related to MTW1 - component of the MIND kinetochore complex n=2 Tax=Pseudozyma flocculosa TaxID=84751 RepID=A0A5C3F3A5_9BASI|nr:uncharacterized protein PFL1_06701 [Pseudozyma flocculosa PF-1]EPQ25707.1 hypothetical protein PFL1_06701 [Pseudozyma flocculosa PF-1]SPO38918.1 related to MTW1 - component of the MIND kinetochore complex [Pseudozyma flocculosa]
MPSTRRASAQAAAEVPSEAAAATEQRLSSPSSSQNPATKPAPRSSKSKASAADQGPAASDSVARPSDHADRDEPSTDAHIALLTEHFGFSPKAFVEALVYLSNEHLYKLAEQFELTALEQLQDFDGGDLEAEQGVHAVLTLLENALDHTLDTFELYCLRSVFGIKARQARLMTLDHHRGLDLRPRGSALPTSSKVARSRKSLATTAAATSANERSHMLGAEEDTLKRKLAAARSVQHDLLLGKQAAEARLAQTDLLHQRFSAILSDSQVAGDDGNDGPHPDGGPAVTAVLGQHARKLCVDAELLLRNLGELRSQDPLGRALLPAVGDGRARKGSASGEEDAANDEPRVWERGREAYLNWEAERMVAKVKGGGDDGGAVGDETLDAAEATLAEEGKTPKRRKGALSAPASSKRRAANGSRNRKQPADSGIAIDHGGDGDGDGDGTMTHAPLQAVGDAAELDRVASALRQRQA